ncbi:MAG TPA: RNB domain-containing ribonuclease [Usitatibacteraceae bacterium]
MNVFYEEDGGFKVGHVMSDIGTSLQVEAISGKRSKIKANQVLLRFETALGEFLPAADKFAAGIEPDFLWEVCGPGEFGCEDLAKEYFGHAPTPAESAGVAIKLHAAPMYFYKRGKGRYQAAPPENLKAALASIERKQREAAQMTGWVEQLKSGVMPEEMRPHLPMLLYKPDRNTLLVKAAEAAAEATGLPLPKLFFNAGAWPDRAQAPHDYHLGKFLADYFPRGTAYQGAIDAVAPAALPPAGVEAYSIDDATTTEIDDAFSVMHLADGAVEVGIHIAAPALFFSRDSELEKLSVQRMSTVYFPGNKITMLPDAAVALATLAEGRRCAALSFYATFASNAAGALELAATRSAIEQVRIARNLRIGEVEQYFHEAAIAAGAAEGEYGAELILLHRLARVLGQRRGKNENEQDRLDFNFELSDGRIDIVPRKRGSPVDTVVSEFMILVNSEWGKLLADSNVAGIYRAQQNQKTRMTTDAAPHEGLGVKQYAWSSSPLRRYVDLVNQRQIIALLKNEAPPFAKRSPELNEITRKFDVTYDAYAEIQRELERYWCLRYLEQEGIREFDATIIRDELVRATALPLIVKLDKSPNLPGKTAVRVAVGELDYWAISGVFTLVETAAAQAQAADAAADAENP